MHHFDYKDGVLHAEGVSLAHLADEVGTPFYCYSSETLTRHYAVFSAAFSSVDALVCYSVKANSNLAVIKTLGALGAGTDVVSGGELMRARAAGIPGSRIIFSGVGKTEEEMALGLREKILCFNVESEAELEKLSAVASARGAQASVSLRVNPDVDAKTHHKISTGKKEDKFGIPWLDARRLYQKAAALPGLQVSGVDMHIGSQITQLDPFADAFTLLRDLVRDLRADGHEIKHLDLGGGLGVPYREDETPPHPDDYAQTVIEAVGDLECQLIFEPGRLIAGNAGILVCKVLYIKPVGDKVFTIVDGAMNDLIRPTLYEAYHGVKPVLDPGDASGDLVRTDIVGPVCETGDYLALNRDLPRFKTDDLLAIMTAGAYGAVQSGTYNSRPLVPEVMVQGDHFAVIRPRPSYDDLLGLDQVPFWLT